MCRCAPGVLYFIRLSNRLSTFHLKPFHKIAIIDNLLGTLLEILHNKSKWWGTKLYEFNEQSLA